MSFFISYTQNIYSINISYIKIICLFSRNEVLLKQRAQKRNLLLLLRNIPILLVLYKSKKSIWVRKLWMSWEENGHHRNLIKEMQLYGRHIIFNFLYMTLRTFEKLLTLEAPRIQGNDTNFCFRLRYCKYLEASFERCSERSSWEIYKPS